MEDNVRQQLNKIVGKELKYPELCKRLQIETPNGSNAKQHHLKDLALYCDIEKLEHPTRYVIHKVYDDEEVQLMATKSKMQLPFEYVIAKILDDNDAKEWYCTNTQLLTCLALVNDNYKIIKSSYFRAQLEEVTGASYESLYECTSKAGRVLKDWADRMLRRMQARGLIFYRQGFCLTKRIKIDEVEKIVFVNVPLQSDTEKKIMGCWAKALKDLGLSNFLSGFVPPTYTQMFYKQLGLYIQEEFNGEYENAHRVNVISVCPTANRQFIQQAKDILKCSEYKRVLNDYSYQRLDNSKSMLDFTRRDMNTLLGDIIRIDGAPSYKKIIDQYKQKEG